MPRIVITLDTTTVHRRGVPFPAVQLKTAYARAVSAAGGLPLLVQPTMDRATVDALLGLADGVLVTGGDFDIPPDAYGEARRDVRVDDAKPLRTGFEAALIEGALQRKLPVLGICGGMQLLNVVRGGTLVQDILSEVDSALDHEQPNTPEEPGHPVKLAAESFLRTELGRDQIAVNTTHHQAVAKLGAGLLATGRAPDGVVELIEGTEGAGSWMLGAQWHPELIDDDVSRAIYLAFVRAAAGRADGSSGK